MARIAWNAVPLAVVDEIFVLTLEHTSAWRLHHFNCWDYCIKHQEHIIFQLCTDVLRVSLISCINQVFKTNLHIHSYNANILVTGMAI